MTDHNDVLSFSDRLVCFTVQGRGSFVFPIQMLTRFCRKFVVGGIILALGGKLIFPVHAQSNDTPWKKICPPPAQEAQTPTKRACHIVQQLYLNKKDEDGTQKTAGRLLGLAVFHREDTSTKKRKTYLIVQMPLGVDLRPGAVLKVDEGKDIPLEFLQCTASGCDASLVLDASLLRSFRLGNRLLIGFRPMSTSKTVVVEASLKGFTKALRQLN